MSVTITGLILAGGRGTRMGTVDKGLQSFRGAPMVAQVLLRLAPQVDQIAINANQNLGAYEAFGVPVWPDELTGFAGPLAGVQAGLMHCSTPYLLIAPCDSPFLPTDLAQQLLDALNRDHAELAVAVTGAAASRQVQPVFCLMKATLLTHLNAYLQSGGRKIDAWYSSLAITEVPFADDTAFRNINTLQELRALDTQLG